MSVRYETDRVMRWSVSGASARMYLGGKWANGQPFLKKSARGSRGMKTIDIRSSYDGLSFDRGLVRRMQIVQRKQPAGAERKAWIYRMHFDEPPHRRALRDPRP